MLDFEFDQTADHAPRVGHLSFDELSPTDRRRVGELVTIMRQRQRDGQSTLSDAFTGFRHAELVRLLPFARQRMHRYVFRQDDFDTSLREDVAAAAGDDDRQALRAAIAAATGLVPSDAAICTHLLQLGIPHQQLARIWDDLKCALGTHAGTGAMPRVM